MKLLFWIHIITPKILVLFFNLFTLFLPEYLDKIVKISSKMLILKLSGVPLFPKWCSDTLMATKRVLGVWFIQNKPWYFFSEAVPFFGVL